jgi:deferrochelatase/peroxidase EfeB
MISPEYNFKQFVEATKKKDVYEIICLAEQEAIGAWRRSYRSDGSVNVDDQKSIDYQNRLKNLIYHMRSHVRPSNIEDPCQLIDSSN